MKLVLSATCLVAVAACSSDSGEAEWLSDHTMFGVNGNQPGQFSKPRAVAFTKDDGLVVIDRTGRIQAFAPETFEHTHQWKLQGWVNGTPTGISLDPFDGSIWVADTHYQRIVRYDTEGNIIDQWGDHGTDPGQMIYPTDVCPDPDGETVWVTEFGLRSRIMQFTRDGKFIQEWGSGEYEYTDLQRPMAITIDNRGRLIIADAGNHRILVYDKTGQRLDVWGEPGINPGELKFPYDLALGPDGSLFICENGNNRITRLSTDGEYLGSWGFAGFKPGGINTPWGICMNDEGTLVIADSYNGRIQVLENAASYFETNTMNSQSASTQQENAG